MIELMNAVRKHAEANYEKGGWDYVVEAWDDIDIIDALVEAKCKTEKQAISAVKKIVKLQNDHRQEMYSTEF